MSQCKLCNKDTKEFGHNFYDHITVYHSLTMEDYYNKINNITEKPRCLECDKELTFSYSKPSNMGYGTFCNRSCNMKNSNKNAKHNLIRSEVFKTNMKDEKFSNSKRRVALSNLSKMTDDELELGKINTNITNLIQHHKNTGIEFRNLYVLKYSDRLKIGSTHNYDKRKKFLDSIMSETSVSIKNIIGNYKDILLLEKELIIKYKENRCKNHKDNINYPKSEFFDLSIEESLLNCLSSTTIES